MNIFRLAAKFERKIIFASFNTFQNIEKIRKAIQELSRQPDLDQKIVNSLANTAKMYHLNARDYGISAGQHAGYLRQLLEDLEKLPTNNQVNQVKSMLNSMVPIGLAAQRKQPPVQPTDPTVIPEGALHWNQVSGVIPDEPSGAAYTPTLTPEESYQEALAKAQALAEPLPPPSSEFLEAQKKMEEIDRYVQENKGKYHP